MKRSTSIILATMVSMQLMSPVMAQKSVRDVEAAGSEAILPPLVDHLGVRATLLYSGMPATDVERILGTPARADTADSEGSSIRVLKYPAEPIGTTVTITDAKLTGVALDIAGIDDRALPTFSRAAWLGMSRAAVLQMLGTPAEDHLRDGYGMTVEQMIFKRPCEPDVSVFLIDGRVAAGTVRSPVDSRQRLKMRVTRGCAAPILTFVVVPGCNKDRTAAELALRALEVDNHRSCPFGTEMMTS